MPDHRVIRLALRAMTIVPLALWASVALCYDFECTATSSDGKPIRITVDQLPTTPLKIGEAEVEIQAVEGTPQELTGNVRANAIGSQGTGSKKDYWIWQLSTDRLQDRLQMTVESYVGPPPFPGSATTQGQWREVTFSGTCETK